MSTPNWSDPELDHEFHVYMVDACDHNSILGELEVYSDSASVSWSQGDDQGIGLTASIEVPDWNQWVKGSWLRIVHRIPSCNYSRILGTFIVWDEGVSGGLNSYTSSPELVGVFRGLEYDLLINNFSIGEGASMKDVMRRVMDATPIECRFSGTYNDYIFSGSYIFDVGESRLDVMRDLCDMGGDIMWPGDTGYVLITAKQDLINSMARFTIDCDSEDSIVYEGSVQEVTTARQVAGRSIAVWNGDDEDEGQVSLSGHSDVSSNHFASPGRRGYVVAELHELEDLSPPRTLIHVQEEAKRWLKEDSTSVTQWNIQTMWLPVVSGDIIDFRPPGGKFRHCVIDTVNADLGNWSTSMTLREV